MNMQKMEQTDELDRRFESLSNRHILKGFKCVLIYLGSFGQKPATLPLTFPAVPTHSHTLDNVRYCHRPLR